MPSLFFRASASLVREEIIERSISAEREKAKARTFKVSDCRDCELASQCLGSGASGKQPRRVSAISKLLGQHSRPKQVPNLIASTEPRALLWCDRNGRQIRRGFVSLLRGQRVTVTRVGPEEVIPAGSPGVRYWTRAERAHRRLTWADRFARNASSANTSQYSFTLFAIPPSLAAYLGLPSSAAA